MADLASFTAGGTVQAGSGLYIRRQADEELLDLCLRGEYAYVLSARQVGKSSLMINVARELRARGVQSAVVDLSGLGQIDVDAVHWYNGILRAIADSLDLPGDLQSWWEEYGDRSHSQRFILFCRQFLLQQVSGRVVVFFDEIDTTLNLPFTDDFFAVIRLLYNSRSEYPDLNRLSFVLIGVATPTDLIKNDRRTPFNIAERVDLDDFDESAVISLVAALGLPADEARATASWVIAWTGGHPYLTLRLLRAMAEEERPFWSRADVDKVVSTIFFGDESARDSNLEHVASRLTKQSPYTYRMLTVYGQILNGLLPVLDDSRSLTKPYLKLSGVVKRKSATLVVRNEIYRRVFDANWVREQKAFRQERLARRAMAVAAVFFAVACAVAVLALVKQREVIAARQALAVEQRLSTQLALQTQEAIQQRSAAEAQRAEADRQKAEAEKQKADADKARARAEEQSKELAAAATREAALRADADRLRQEAEAQRNSAQDSAERANASAETARKLADSETKARHEAEQNATRANAETVRANTATRQLLGIKLIEDADLLRAQQPDLSDHAMLLDLEAYQRLKSSDPTQARQALEDGLDKLPRRVASWKAADAVSTLALDANGSRMIMGDAAGKVHLVSLPGAVEDGSSRDLPKVAGVAVDDQGYPLAVDQAGLVAHQSPGVEPQVLLAVRRDARAWAALVQSDPRKVNYWVSVNSPPRVLRHHAKVLRAAFGDKFFYAFCEDSTVYAWSLASFKPRVIDVPKDVPPADARFFAVTEKAEPSMILLGSAGSGSPNLVRVYQIRTTWIRRLLILDRATYAAQLTSTLQHEGPVRALALNANSNFVTTASGSSVRRWNIGSGREVFRMNAGPRVDLLALSGDDRSLATAQAGSSVTVWQTEAGAAVSTLPSASSNAWHIAFSSDGRRLDLAGVNRTGSWDWRQGAQAQWAVSSDQPRIFSLDGTRSAALVMDLVVRPASGAASTQSRTKPAPTPAFQFLVFTDRNGGRARVQVPLGVLGSDLDLSPDGLFAAVSTPAAVKLFRADTGAAVAGFEYSKSASPLAVAPGGGVVAAGQPKGIDIIRGNKVIATVPIANPRSLFFTRDGKYLAVGAPDGSRLVESVNWTVAQTLSHAATSSVALSPDNSYVALIEGEGSVRISEIGNPSDPGMVLKPSYTPTRLAFSPDHKYLATASVDGFRVLLWQLQDLVDEACRRVRTTSLSQGEWQKYLSGEPYNPHTCPAR